MSGEAAGHLRRVLRASAGQIYELSDGAAVRIGKIERVSRDGIEFSLHEALDAAPPSVRISVGLSIVKFDRFEWAIEKATELGAGEIHPLAAARSERALLAAATKRAARWRRILAEAAQQSRRVRPPELYPAANIDKFLRLAAATNGAPSARIWFSEDAAAPALRTVLASLPRESPPAAIIAIGPEGGWTDEENAAAARAGFSAASLGPQILRTETAIIAALAALNYALGE